MRISESTNMKIWKLVLDLIYLIYLKSPRFLRSLRCLDFSLWYLNLLISKLLSEFPLYYLGLWSFSTCFVYLRIDGYQVHVKVLNFLKILNRYQSVKSDIKLYLPEFAKDCPMFNIVTTSTVPPISVIIWSKANNVGQPWCLIKSDLAIMTKSDCDQPPSASLHHPTFLPLLTLFTPLLPRHKLSVSLHWCKLSQFGPCIYMKKNSILRSKYFERLEVNFRILFRFFFEIKLI